MSQGQVALLSFEQRLAESVRRSQAYMPGEAWNQVKLLLAPEALSLMAGVTTAWAVSHFFGVGEAADAILLVGAGATFGWSAVQIGDEFCKFASLVQHGRTDAELDDASRHFAKAVVLGGVTPISGILFKARPKGTLKELHFGGPAKMRPSPARTPGSFYKPIITERAMSRGRLGVTSAYGDITINSTLPSELKAETLLHEKVHQSLFWRSETRQSQRTTLGFDATLSSFTCSSNSNMRWARFASGF